MVKENLNWTLAMKLDWLRDKADGQHRSFVLIAESFWPELEDTWKLDGIANFPHMPQVPLTV